MASSEPSWPVLERRRTGDRRMPPVFPPQFSRFRRRRSKGRRKSDTARYVDIYSGWNWGLALGVMALSFIDAILTVYQIQRGSVREANPIMSLALQWGGVYLFFSLKAAMTAFPLAIIILHKEWPLARVMAMLCLGFYVMILIYHLYLVGDLSAIGALWRTRP